jgi:prophage maintenance system killer protein
MAKEARKQIGLNMRATLYDDLTKLAKDNGQTTTYVLEQAAEQNGYYSNLIEEASALMESQANNHAFLDGNKLVSFVVTDAMLRANGYFLDVEPFEGHNLITEAMEQNGFRFPMILDWIASIVKPLPAEENRAQKKK